MLKKTSRNDKSQSHEDQTLKHEAIHRRSPQDSSHNCQQHHPSRLITLLRERGKPPSAWT